MFTFVRHLSGDKIGGTTIYIIYIGGGGGGRVVGCLPRKMEVQIV
jgi:hypothetical protein